MTTLESFNMKIRRTILLSLLGCMAIAMTGAEKLPVVEVLGRQYYVYEIKKGDSLFGVARKFGWDDKEIARLNPTATSPMQKGAKIYYPVEEKGKVANPVKTTPENLQQSPLKHKVQRGETVYSISKMYGIPVTTIYNLNPSSKQGIKAGEELTLQTVKDVFVSDNDSVKYHTIKAGETLYGVARANGVTVEAILAENPGVTESNFRADAVIKIPPKGTGVVTERQTVTETHVNGFDTYKVGKNESWSSIANKTGVNVEQLREANPRVELKNKKIISVPRVENDTVERIVVKEDAREQTSDGVRDIYADVHNISETPGKSAVSLAVVLDEPKSKKDLDFSRGIITAINRLKNSAYKINLKIIDGSKGEAFVENELATFKPTIIFASADKNLPEYLVAYSSEQRVPLVNTFDVKSEAFADNSYTIQLLPPSNYFNDEVSGYLFKEHNGAYLVMAGEKDSGDTLGESIASAWDPGKVIYTSTEGLAELAFKDYADYVIYGYPVKKAEVQDLLKSIGDARLSHGLCGISVVGRPNWVLYDESLSQLLHENDVVVPSRFYYDEKSETARRFDAEYRELFDHKPVKSMPLYAAVGYDTALYFITSMAKTGGDLNEFTPSKDMVQNDIIMTRPRNWSGILNPAVYMLRFTPFDTVEKNIIQ